MEVKERSHFQHIFDLLFIIKNRLKFLNQSEIK